MSSADSVEISSATVEEAIKEALAKLDANEDDVAIEVLATPRSGVLGLGARLARVRVTRRPLKGARSGVQSPPPRTAPPVRAAREAAAAASPAQAEASPPPGAAPDSRHSLAIDEQGREAAALLSKLLDLMGERCEVRPMQTESGSIGLEIKGDGSGLLIGRHGQTLEALEYLINRLLGHRIKDVVPVVLDTESYRERRRQQLERMALSMGERAKREHQTVTLEPMSPSDRRIVHLALKDDPLVTTRSSGDGFKRSVEIVPVDGSRPRQGRQRQAEPPIGEQGGFKHGQKKIV